MEPNWYVICTQKKREKKVVALLTKKGIESYCPFTITETRNASRSTKEYGPLFKSHVFVNVIECDIQIIKRVSYVVNPLYWRSKLAIVNPDEINAIKMMIENYNSICLEKISVNTNENITIKEKNITGYTNNVITIQHQGITVTLPTLGYSISAERDKERTATQTEKKESMGDSLARRLNPLLLFGF